MRLTKNFWIYLGVVILVAAAITLYMLYRGQANEQKGLNADLATADTQLQLLIIEQGSIEAQIEQLESDLIDKEGETSQLEAEISHLQVTLAQLQDERAQAEAQALLLLSAAESKYFSSAESIEYDEILFSFAHDANLQLVQIDASEPVETVVDGISYKTTAFNISVWGDEEEILNYINMIVEYEAFKTTVLETFNMDTPELLTDQEKSELEASIKAELKAQEIAKITTEEMIEFITEAIVEVAGPVSNWPKNSIDVPSIEAMALEIKDQLDGLVGAEFVDVLPIDLASIIQESIEDSIQSKIIQPLAEMIAQEIQNGANPVDLLGKDIAGLMQEDIMGSLQGNILGLLNAYVASLIEMKITDSVAAAVDAAAPQITMETIEGMEMSSSSIKLVIYTYEGR